MFWAIVVAVVVVQGAVAPPEAVAFGGISRALKGIIRQVIEVTKPPVTKLTYGYCNAQSCGTSENLECVGNLYIPGFLGDLTRQISIVGPSIGSSLKSLQIATGSTAPSSFESASGGGLGGISGGIKAVISQINGLPKLDLNIPIPGGIAAALRDLGGLSKGEADKQERCGIPEAQKTKVTEANPNGVENPFANIRVLMEWTVPPEDAKKAETTGSYNQDVTVDGATSNVVTAAAPPAPFSSDTTAATTFSQAELKGNVATPSGGTAALADVGTVPTAIANLMGQLGVAGVRPDKVSTALLQSGSWKPGEGTNLTATAANPGFLGSLVPPATPTTFVTASATITELAVAMSEKHVVPAVASQLGGQPAVAVGAIVAWAKSGTSPGGAAVVTGFDAEDDSFGVINALGQRDDVSYEALGGLLRRRGQAVMVAVKAVKR